MEAELISRKKSWFRLRLEKLVDDHGWLRVLLASCTLVALVMFPLGWMVGGAQSPSLRYGVKALDTLVLELFGGQQKIERARDIYQDMAAFSRDEYDRMDVIATSLYITSTGFEDILSQTIKNQGEIRILVLDPDFAFSHPEHFEQLAQEFGNTPEQLLAECWLTLSALNRIQQTLAKDALDKRFSVRLYQQPQTGITGAHLIKGRAYFRYASSDPNQRFDLIVPYTNLHESKLDSPLRAAWRFKNRLHHPMLEEYRMAFEATWKTAKPWEKADKMILNKMNAVAGSLTP